MKTKTVLAAAVVLWAGCSRPTPPASGAAEARRRTETVTRWSPRTELFLEYPVLVRGQDSRLAIHLTRLDSFKAVTAGRCEVRLAYEGGQMESFSTDGPARPGIFGVTIRPAGAGKARLTIRLSSGSLADAHEIGPVEVYASSEKVPAAADKGEEAISFLKEQQWTLDFATTVAEVSTVRPSLRVPAEVTPRSGGETEVTVPFNGRMIADNMPPLGARVTKGQVLALVVPPTENPGNLAALELAKAEAAASLSQTGRDRERAARLVEAGAAPAKRLEEARTAEVIAQARLDAAERRLKQYEASRAAVDADRSSTFALRAPITGIIAETHAVPGANLKAGETLFRIVDTDRVYGSAIVPEAELPKIRQVTGAELEVPGLDRPRAAGRLVSIGKIIDPATRTFPVIYEVDNQDGRMAIHQTLFVRLFLSGPRPALLVPESAIVDDGGRPVVFVQKDGESFQRRPVKIGLRQRGSVEVVEGLSAGERVVTRGAYLIRLAALSNQIPVHGHVH